MTSHVLDGGEQPPARRSSKGEATESVAASVGSMRRSTSPFEAEHERSVSGGAGHLPPLSFDSDGDDLGVESGGEDTTLIHGNRSVRTTGATSWSRRRRIWEFLARTGPPHVKKAAKLYEGLICFLVAMLFLVDLLDTGADHETSGAFMALDLLLVFALSTEFFARIYTAVEDPQLQRRAQASHKSGECGLMSPASLSRVDSALWRICQFHRLDWEVRVRILSALKLTMILDALTIFSLLLDLAEIHKGTEQVFYRLIRVLTLCRLERELRFLHALGQVTAGRSRELTATLFAAGIVLLVSSVAMHYLEAPHNPQFSSLGQSVWWGTAALTTVGYGDTVPITAAGRVLGGVVSVVGAALLAIPAGIFAAGFQEVVNEDKSPAKSLQVRSDDPQLCIARLDKLEASVDALKAEVQAMRSDQREILLALQSVLRRDSVGHDS